MSLGRKSLALFLLLGVGLCAGSYAVLKSAVFPAFEEFERESSQQAITRVTRMLQEDLRAIDIMNIEYSSWTQTYEYALGERPMYAEENLDPVYWRSVDVDLFAVFDNGGNELFSWMADTGGNVAEFGEQLDFALQAGHPLISHRKTDDALSGFLTIGNDVFQIVSRPILTSDGEGPIAGTLIVGQALSTKRIAALGQRATVDMSILRIGIANLPEHVVARVNEASAAEMASYTRVGPEAIHSYRLLTDVFGDPIAYLETSAPRRISAIGSRIVNTTMLALALGSAVFLTGGLYLLHAFVTKPVTRLTEQIVGMRGSGDLAVDIDASRTDEVGTLAKEFSLLTERLGGALTELEGARDEALAMSKAKSQFLARMSHEIRTPMNGILGMTELLRDTRLDDRQQQFAGTIYESGEALLCIINDILDISKIEAGRIELDMAPFNLQYVVEECLELLAEYAHRKGLELACKIPLDLEPNVRGDAIRLRQILMNLVGNALKFTAHGEVIIRVSEQRNIPGRQRYRFEIEDTGIGISPENQERIFEAFIQEDGSNTRRYGGTGLGLAISRQLVELMDGEIGVTSSKDRGSLFWFEIELSTDKTLSANRRVRHLAGTSALVVDDNATNREILRHQLEGWGMSVTAARSGYEAMSILTDTPAKRPPPDVMLLDVAMPGMDGLQLAKSIRGEGSYRHVPIVMLSSILRSDVDDESRAPEPDEWLAKPVRQSRLYDSLLAVLNRDESGEDKTEPQDIERPHDVEVDRDGVSVLLVDDNDVNLAVAREMLAVQGYNVAVARDGVQAVAAVKEQVFDAILMDCHMPEMDGFEATQRIREFERGASREPTPIIALTAHALEGDRERCIDAGMDEYLSKPFTKLQLQSVVDEQIRRPADPASAQDPEPSTPASDVMRGIPGSSKGLVLVVDDNKVNQQVAQSMLKSIGFETRCAENGNQALAAIGAEEFDLILMDCHMPELDGYETTREIRRREEKAAATVRIPIVAVTADFLESNRQSCIDAGMDDYVMKPFTQQQLRAVTMRWLVGAAANEPISVPVDEDGFSKLGDIQALACIDRDVFNEIRELDASEGATVVREIVVSYCATSTKMMVQLRTAVTDESMDLVEAIAHSLKGGSGQIGAAFLATLCEKMITAAKDADIERLEALLERAAMEHSAVLSALDIEIQTDAA
ncbi:MAG: response regulator [Gammaproteobacteria bacterium]|nr:response regulator [Gammaproteobacteria bacterium]